MININDIPLNNAQLKEVEQETEECMLYFIEITNSIPIDDAYYNVLSYAEQIIKDWNKVLVLSK